MGVGQGADFGAGIRVNFWAGLGASVGVSLGAPILGCPIGPKYDHFVAGPQNRGLIFRPIYIFFSE